MSVATPEAPDRAADHSPVDSAGPSGRWQRIVAWLRRAAAWIVALVKRVRAWVTAGPMYPRLLRLKHIELNGWQRAALVEGMALVGALATLADKATAWTPLVLPVAAAVVVKFHDVLAGVLPAPPEPPGDEE